MNQTRDSTRNSAGNCHHGAGGLRPEVDNGRPIGIIIDYIEMNTRAMRRKSKRRSGHPESRRRVEAGCPAAPNGSSSLAVNPCIVPLAAARPAAGANGTKAGQLAATAGSRYGTEEADCGRDAIREEGWHHGFRPLRAKAFFAGGRPGRGQPAFARAGCTPGNGPAEPKNDAKRRDLS